MFTPLERQIIRLILKSDGVTIRASKPRIRNRIDSYAAYVWRMVSFFCSPNPKLQCMPVMCWYDIIAPSDEERKVVARGLNELVDKITALIPVSEWHGVFKWKGLI